MDPETRDSDSLAGAVVQAETRVHKVSRYGNIAVSYYPLLNELPRDAHPDKRPKGQHQYTLQYNCRMTVTVLLRERKFVLRCKDWEEEGSVSWDIDGGVGFAWCQITHKLDKWQTRWRQPADDQSENEAPPGP